MNDPAAPTTPRVALVKSPGRADAFAQALRNAGFAPVLVSPFRVEPVTDGHAALAEALAGGAEWVVFTSPNAVAQLETAASELHRRLRGATAIAAVGPGTAAALHTLGLEPTVVGTGGGTALADAILRRGTPSAARVVHPCGEERRPELSERLAAAGLRVTEVPLYRTVPDAVGERAAQDGTFQVVVLGSPRLAQRAIELFPDRPLCVAIGRTTAAALRDLGWRPAGIAAGPSPVDVARAVATALRRDRD